MKSWLHVTTYSWDAFRREGVIGVEVGGTAYAPVVGSQWFFDEFRRIYKRNKGRALKFLEPGRPWRMSRWLRSW